MGSSKKTKGIFSFYCIVLIIIPMVKILPSTFKLLNEALPVVDNRRPSIALVRHFSIPFTVLADMVVGIASLVFLGIRGELTEKRFWDISHEHFFVYPFQQLIYFLFASLGTLWKGNYFEGYRLGQWAVMNLSYETYRGPPQIFSHVIESYDCPQYFSNITLTDGDHRTLQDLVRHTDRFWSHVAKIDEDHPLKNAAHVYEVFYSERPLSIHQLDDIFHAKLEDVDCAAREALTEAKLALEAFFSLRRIIQVRLTKY